MGGFKVPVLKPPRNITHWDLLVLWETQYKKHSLYNQQVQWVLSGHLASRNSILFCYFKSISEKKKKVTSTHFYWSYWQMTKHSPGPTEKRIRLILNIFPNSLSWMLCNVTHRDEKLTEHEIQSGLTQTQTWQALFHKHSSANIIAIVLC